VSEDRAASRVRVAGFDLGQATARLVIASVAPGGEPRVERVRSDAHGGQPFDLFRAWYREEQLASCAALGVTGLHAREVVAPALGALPDDACLEAGLRLTDPVGPINVVRVGARGYSVLTRDDQGELRYVENEKCSSGTGETMVKIAGRFGLTIEEADARALAAARAIPITARCSVFAKSEMTHFANQGRPADELFRGYFESVARNVAALLARARVDGPVHLIGGAARLATLARALSERVGAPVVVGERALHLEALGAAVLAGEHASARTRLPDDPDALLRERRRRVRALPTVGAWAATVKRLEAAPAPAGASAQPAVLGLDLGSTGSKAALTSLETGELVLDVYDRTQGNPVEAMGRLLRALRQRAPAADVRAIGVTGSGREAVATVLRAAYPACADRVVVVNEIVAHATAAIRCDDRGGESLSVVEIGGQDAKFIQIAGGVVVESDMNKACSAGTGSFLEEQAAFYGVDDIARFTDVAQAAERAPDLGQMCTVFVAETAGEALDDGYSVADIFAGFQYSVIHNYIHRVMGQRTFGERVFFQGKPATNPALAWTLAAVAGREVIVPPNPGAMGAWGIGLLASRELGQRALREAPTFELEVALSARIAQRAELRCRDEQCATYCVIEKATVAVGDERRTILSGGACPKYEVASAGRAKLPREAPSAFDERRALLAELLDRAPASRGEGPRVGIPVGGALVAVLPWAVTLLTELGARVRLLESDGETLTRGEERCYSYDACAPAKVAHGLADADQVDAVFFPKLIDLPTGAAEPGTTCPVEQGLPDMAQAALRARGRSLELLRPVLSLASGLTGPLLLWQLRDLPQQLGVRRRRLILATRRAAAAQRRADAALRDVGRRTLAYGRAHGVPVVVVCGSLHVMHDRAINAKIPALLRSSGVLALPQDCFPLPGDLPDLDHVQWADARRALQAALAARARGDVYPLYLSSFGCGPASFSEQVFARLLDGHPHTALETDGHGGTAGYQTRIQAFLHAVRQHDGQPSQVPDRHRHLLAPPVEPPLDAARDSQLVLLAIGDQFAPITAAFYRSLGFDAVPSGPADSEGLALGRRDCSGKECLPYQLIWGSFRKRLEQEPADRPSVLVQIGGGGGCRNCMFPTKDRQSLERLGLTDRVSVRTLKPEPALEFVTRLWSGLVVWDLLRQLAAYHGPLPGQEQAIEETYQRACDEVVRHMERPRVAGKRAVLAGARWWRGLCAILDRASIEFARHAARTSWDGPRVLVTGDVYLRVDPFASDDVIRRLNRRGLRVLVDPMGTLSEYLYAAGEPAQDVANFLKDELTRVIITTLADRLYGRVRRDHPWIVRQDMAKVRDAADSILPGRRPAHEAAALLGTVLHHWEEGACDGVVVVNPWGCGPALVAEGLLRHRRDTPVLYLYSDGSPIDDRRLDAFAFRLRRGAQAAVVGAPR